MRSSRWQGIEDGRSFQARELAAETGLTAYQVAQAARKGYTRQQIREIVKPTSFIPKVHLLVGANIRMAEYWCDEHEMSRREVGRTVFTTSMPEDRLRGRRCTVELVYQDERGHMYPDRVRWGNPLVQTAHMLNQIYGRVPA